MIVRLAREFGAHAHIVHVASAEAADEVARAKADGVAVTAETCPHYLFLTNDAYERPDFDGAKYVMTPPLRDRHHQQALWRGLSRRAAYDVVLRLRRE